MDLKDLYPKPPESSMSAQRLIASDTKDDGLMKNTQAAGPVTKIKDGVPSHVCNTCKPPETFDTAKVLLRHKLAIHEPYKPEKTFQTSFGTPKRSFSSSPELGDHPQDVSTGSKSPDSGKLTTNVRSKFEDRPQYGTFDLSINGLKDSLAGGERLPDERGYLRQRGPGVRPPAQRESLRGVLNSFVDPLKYRINTFGTTHGSTSCSVNGYRHEILEAVVKAFDAAKEDHKVAGSSQTTGDGMLDIDDYLYVFGSGVYTWALNFVLRELRLDTPGSGDNRDYIRQRITRSVNNQITLGQEYYDYSTYHFIFRVPWVADFLASQEYNIPAHEALPRVIVLTGTEGQAYATTCLQYVQMVWPESGAQILDLYISLMRDDAETAKCTLLNETTLVGSVGSEKKKKNVDISVTGTVNSIAEVGDQLAWLSAALRSSPTDGVFCLNPPSLDIPNQPVKSKSTTKKSNVMVFAKCDPVQSGSYTNSQGTCWMRLFRNPVLVEGYPIPGRERSDTSIEIALITMAALANTRKITRYAESMFIKGASTIFIPTGRTDDTIFWHMVFNEDGSYISFSDARIKQYLRTYPKGLTLSNLEVSRHILRWCSDVENATGAPSAQYTIGWSQLSRPLPGFAFEKVTISGGSFITGGVSTIIGKKDKAVHIWSRNDYIMRLKWISKKLVVLYDTQDRRAWLVDGTSALLHLVRASLEYDSKDEPFESLFLYDPSTLEESQHKNSGKQASIQVLTNTQNMSLALYAQPDDTREEVKVDDTGARSHVLSNIRTNYCLKDRIESICDILEKIIAHQADVSTQDGVGFQIKKSSRRHIQGFDFMDIATDEDPFWPRMTTLQSTGRGWVDFARAIHAITLFGTGFGDLIRPVKGDSAACALCCFNTEVPKGQDFLTVCVPELQEILQKRGSPATTPWRVVDEIYWHNPDMTFEPCQCSKPGSAKHDRVQVLLPATFPRLWARGFKSPAHLSLTPRGAFIFGHSWRLPLRWKDRGCPEEGHPHQDLEELENSFRDSGVGTSPGSPFSLGTGIGSVSPSCSADATDNSPEPREAGPSGTTALDDERSQPAKRRRLLAAPGMREQRATTPEDVPVPEEGAEKSREGRFGVFLDTLTGRKTDKKGKGRAT